MRTGLSRSAYRALGNYSPNKRAAPLVGPCARGVSRLDMDIRNRNPCQPEQPAETLAVAASACGAWPNFEPAG